MQIPQEFPQFEDGPSLLVVVGWQSGKLYFGFDGKLEELDEVRVEDHKYSDDEGHFETRTGSQEGTAHSGSPKEKKKQHIRSEFLRRFIKLLKRAVKEKEVTALYIFSPAEGLPGLEEALPSELGDLVKGFYKGNFLNIEVEKLLKKIDKEKSKGIEVMSEEARKILEKTEK